MLRCSDRAQPPWIERPQISTSTRKKKISKKTWKMTEKNDFSFSSNCYQSLTLVKCLTRAHLYVAGGITCPTAYIRDPRVLDVAQGTSLFVYLFISLFVAQVNFTYTFKLKKKVPDQHICMHPTIPSVVPIEPRHIPTIQNTALFALILHSHSP